MAPDTLRSAGTLILTGNAAHLVENFAHQRVPSFNADAALTRASIDKPRALAEQSGAKILVNYDREQRAAFEQARR